jgi:hypothetical protein
MERILDLKAEAVARFAAFCLGAAAPLLRDLCRSPKSARFVAAGGVLTCRREPGSRSADTHCGTARRNGSV